MALTDIEQKNIAFYTTVTNNPVDATMLPIIFKKSGKVVISYSETDKKQSPHIWLGGEHIASGYGQDLYKDKENLSYISNSYNICWDFVVELDQYSPFLTNKDYRAAVLKDSNSYSFSNNTLVIGKDNLILQESPNSIILGYDDYLRGEGTTIIGNDNQVRSKNSFIAGNHIKTPQSENQFIMGVHPYVSNNTAFAFGNGFENNDYNILEIDKDGELYIRGIGVTGDRNIINYNGRNINGGINNSGNLVKPQSFQSYISASFSYGIDFSCRYTNDQIANLIGGAPEELDTLKEISEFISDIKKDNYNYIPVDDYNKLNSSETYYTCVWDRDIDIYNDEIKNNMNYPYIVVEYILKEFWKRDIRECNYEPNGILANFNLDYILGESILTSSINWNTVFADLGHNFNPFNSTPEEAIKRFCLLRNVYIDELFKDTFRPDDPNTKLEVDGEPVDKKGKVSLYDYLHRYEECHEDIEYIYNDHFDNDTIYYYSVNSTSLISSVQQIQNSYITNTGTAKSNVGYTWVPSLGETTYLNTILDALLERPIYTKPELNLICEKTFEVGDTIEPTIRFDFGETVMNPNNVDFEHITTNDNRGYSYSYADNDMLYDFKLNIYSSHYADMNFLSGNIPITYTFPSLTLGERDYEIVSYIDYEYKQSTYMYYPQLLANRNPAVVICVDGWFGEEEKRYDNKYIISAKYKYYYGWDNIPDYSGLNLADLAEGIGWLNRTNDTQINVRLSSTRTHNLLWFACPVKYSQKNDEHDYYIFYHTKIVDQDFLSNSVTKEEVITTNKVSVCGEKYIIYILNLNREYTFEDGDYLKLIIKRV